MDIQINLPVTREGLRGHVRHALGLGLPELLPAHPDVGASVALVANGPSALMAPLAGPNRVAVNGALTLFTRAGLAPRFWICCDPGAIVAEFLAEAPAETTYLVPSQAHPAVFAALEHRDVRVWHSADRDIADLLPQEGAEMVLGGITTTLRALSLFARMGVAHFDIWGWDCCRLGGADHAAPQRHEFDAATVKVPGIGGFASSLVWSVELGQAVRQIAGAHYTVAVHGEGLLAATLRYLAVPQAVIVQ